MKKKTIRTQIRSSIKIENWPITKLINLLEGEANRIEQEWIKSDTTLEEDFQLQVAAHSMRITAMYLRMARHIAIMQR